MIFELFIALVCGVTAGVFTGLTPGIHTNLVGVFLVSSSVAFLSKLNPIYLVVLISSMAITHTFIDFIPSILLGAPDTDTELSTLPGHSLLKEGRAYEAIMFTNYGSLISIFLLVVLSPVSIVFFPKIYQNITPFIGYILIATSLILILTEQNKFQALIVFSLTGVLGLIVLNIQINEPLLPLLTGLFGASGIILSIKEKTKIPPQIITPPSLKLKKPIISSLIASPLCGFLPGLGSGQAAVIGNTLVKNDKEEFLVLLGITNTIVMGFSFLSLFLISKTRTGAAVAIQELVGELNFPTLILILTAVLITGVISFFLTSILAKFFSINISKINYTKISFTTLFVIFLITLLVSGIIGILVLIISTFTGIYSITSKVKRTNMMGCLLLPTIIFYLTL